jgi:hypothetical protein
MASKLFYTDLLKDVSEERLGISRKLINDTLRKPSYRYDTSLDSRQVGLYLKRHQEARGPYYLLVATRVPDMVTRNVDLALIIPDDVVEDIDITKPLKVLQKFIRCFGLDLVIGDTTQKFFFQQTIPLETGLYAQDQIVRVDNPANHSFALQSFLKLDTSGEHIVANCALAYCVDIDEYTLHLDQKKHEHSRASSPSCPG